MIDYRINTFLKLCDTMNYRLTSEILNLTQPAVTQHIQYLEKIYNCKLFIYTGRKLIKTPQCKILENYARSAKYNEYVIRMKMNLPKVIPLKIGATKTIGDYVIKDYLINLFKISKYNISIVVDNTKKLLDLLDTNKLDVALIEGYFDKNKYGYKLLRKESFLGICNYNHPFADKEVLMEELFSENIIIREEGSGTKAIFEQILKDNNYSLNNFKHQTCINSFKLIEECILKNIGITFAYESFAKSNLNFRTFNLKDTSVIREFNYVYLKDADVNEIIEDLINIL